MARALLIDTKRGYLRTRDQYGQDLPHSFLPADAPQLGPGRQVWQSSIEYFIWMERKDTEALR